VLRYLFALSLMLLIPCAARGQGDERSPKELPPAPADGSTIGPGMSLVDFQTLAIEHNPTLASARARIAAARGKQFQAGRYPNPAVGYHSTVMGNFGTAGMQGGYIAQKFITGGKLNLDQAIAGKGIDEAHFKFHAQERRVLNDVEIRYFEALAAQRRVELTKELARIGDDLVEATKKLLAGGLRTENDLLQAEIRANEAHILLDNSHNDLEGAWRRLAAVAGTPGLEVSSLAGHLETDLPNLGWEECQVNLFAAHPELNAARARSEGAKIAIERARREPIPNVDAWVSVRHNYINGDDVANAQVGVPVPVFDRNRGNISAAESEWIAACKNIERIKLRLQDQLATAYRRYANARQQAERYSQRIVPRAERSLELVTNGYEMGQVDYLTLLTAQQTYVQVTLSYIDSLRELRTASAIIEGQLLTDSLAAPQ